MSALVHTRGVGQARPYCDGGSIALGLTAPAATITCGRCTARALLTTAGAVADSFATFAHVLGDTFARFGDAIAAAAAAERDRYSRALDALAVLDDDEDDGTCPATGDEHRTRDRSRHGGVSRRCVDCGAEGVLEP